MPPLELFNLLALGLFAGAIGGLVGVGGSIVIIPVLTLLMHRNQHLSQAAAMIVNVFVAAPALMQHQRAEAVRWDIVVRMLPFGLVFIVVGVEASNFLHGDLLKKLYGAFLLYVIAFSVMKMVEDRRPAADSPPERVGWGPAGSVGGLMGFAAGLLGIGGAPVALPLLQRVCHLPLRQAIASTSAVMCITAIVGATRKSLTLSHVTDASGVTLGLSYHDSVHLAVYLAPTAVIGAMLGAKLTHRVPVQWVRLAFILLMVWASANMLGLNNLL